MSTINCKHKASSTQTHSNSMSLMPSQFSGTATIDAKQAEWIAQYHKPDPVTYRFIATWAMRKIQRLSTQAFMFIVLHSQVLPLLITVKMPSCHMTHNQLSKFGSSAKWINLERQLAFQTRVRLLRQATKASQYTMPTLSSDNGWNSLIIADQQIQIMTNFKAETQCWLA